MTDYNPHFQLLSDSGDEEFIPIISAEDEKAMHKEEVPENMPLLSLRNTVLFPGVVIPITVGRDRSIRLIKEAKKNKKHIGVVSQKDAEVEMPNGDDLNHVGTVARIIKMLRMPDGTNTVILQGQRRFVWDEIVEEEKYLIAKVSAYGGIESLPDTKATQALVESLKDLAIEIIEMSPTIPSEAAGAIKNIERLSFLVNFIGSNMNASVKAKQKLLEIEDLEERANKVLQMLHKEKQILELKHDIQSKVRNDLDQQQREYFLNQQMKKIQEELGANPLKEEIEERKTRALKKKWPEAASELFDKEIQKLERMNPQAAEYSMQSNYIELLLDLPWDERSKDNFDLKNAVKVLNSDHYGLDKVKERIVEHLAVLKIKGDLKAPILCLYGPPGVGKTSLGRSIAESLGRKYVRMSLGGMRDEAEIRGHRRTYIGAMPGRILQNLKKAGTSNPLFVLDEIDKLAKDSHGDPSSALLEVLDPEQNSTFHDNYLDLDYDLSRVMFIATCNDLSTIHPALRDRMEIIEVSGYTIQEKVQIAKRHLLPKLVKDTGLNRSQVTIPIATIEKIVELYTNESGVRGLDKRIAKVVRNRAKEIAMEEPFTAEVAPSDLINILGRPYEKDRYQNNDVAGVVTGLAWTPTGGDILFIETSLTHGKGKLTLTGNLGEVMKESAIIALEYLKAHCVDLGIAPERFEKWNVHVHVPQGAIKKDGPSAGITMLTALASAFTQRKVRKYLAMSGEITLRGQVLPVGGIKEKILAAKRAGIKEIILCERNRQDIEDIDARYVRGMKFTYATKMNEVVKRALLSEKVETPIDFGTKLN
ncbi:MAG TPA: endopeptidase La [Flavobacteriales bacterium]|jgi:ATP-dependent Lon protease|nr:endopeptidase La [Flavobacteriales bacterium]HIB77842.1 endopeptidase La [Flavobacteriales bacterium]HIN42327.1 endopeptidase La [Flavobacteriales bacterium]HIO16305.1 endopeptidase La [Flavobacteriales bacterium]HIO59316.1 endopeptidase La [Flavobacteriales bacterium]